MIITWDFQDLDKTIGLEFSLNIGYLYYVDTTLVIPNKFYSADFEGNCMI